MKKLIFLLLLPMLVISSCKKDNGIVHSTYEEDNTNGTEMAAPGPGTHRIRAVIHNSGEMDRYEYDNAGRIRVIQNAIKKTIFIYPSRLLVIQNEYNSAGTLIRKAEYKLNGNDLLDTARYFNPTLDGPYKYAFTPSGQIDHVARLDPNNGNAIISIKKYHYSGDQLDSIITTNASGNLILRDLYDYNLNVANTTTEQYRGFLFLGLQSPQAVKKHTAIGYNTNGSQMFYHVVDFLYDTDLQGRIIQESASTVSSTTTTKYIYY